MTYSFWGSGIQFLLDGGHSVSLLYLTISLYDFITKHSVSLSYSVVKN